MVHRLPFFPEKLFFAQKLKNLMRITRRLVTHCKMVLFHTKDVIDFCCRRYVKSGELSVVHNAYFCRCKVLGDSESNRNGTRNINSIYYVYSKHFADGFLILSMIFFSIFHFCHHHMEYRNLSFKMFKSCIT